MAAAHTRPRCTIQCKGRAVHDNGRPDRAASRASRMHTAASQRPPKVQSEMKEVAPFIATGRPDRAASRAKKMHTTGVAAPAQGAKMVHHTPVLVEDTTGTRTKPTRRAPRHPGPSPVKTIRSSHSFRSFLPFLHSECCSESWVHLTGLCAAPFGARLLLFGWISHHRIKSVCDYVWRRFATTERHTHTFVTF